MSALPPVLGPVVDLVVRCCDPDEVLLFGSYAKGHADRHSDLDLLVVGDFRTSPYLRAREVRDLLARFPIPIDIHLVTWDELRAGARRPGSFLATIRCASIPLYRRDPTDAGPPDRLPAPGAAAYADLTGGT
jgi:predicted nucleotidyltransferase